jgi:hypothetical protein
LHAQRGAWRAVSIDPVGEISQTAVGFRAISFICEQGNGGNPQLAWALNISWCGRSGSSERPRKGRMKMFGPNFQRNLLAAFASLLVSSVAVGSAVLPAQVAAAPINAEIVTYA